MVIIFANRSGVTGVAPSNIFESRDGKWIYFGKSAHEGADFVELHVKRRGSASRRHRSLLAAAP